MSKPFVAVNIPSPKDIQGCISFAFDRWQLNFVDKIIIETPIKETVITKRNLIKKIVNATDVAEATGFQSIYGYYFIRLYNGEKLVREMEQSATFTQRIMVYRPDCKYWIFANTNQGTVYLSDKLFAKIEEALEKDGNSYSVYSP